MRIRTGLSVVILSAVVSAQSPAPPRIVKGWAALMQAMQALDDCITSGELSAVHDEDAALQEALTVLRDEPEPSAPAARQELTRTVTVFGQQIGDLHQAADSFDLAGARARWQTLRQTYAGLARLYGEQIRGPARALAAVYACPMHRDVTGAKGQPCAKCGMAMDYAVRVPLAYYGQPDYSTVRARIRIDQPPRAGQPVKATLYLNRLNDGEPLLITDLRVVHTERIHLLIVDPGLKDYHHVHPQPTAERGAYTFTFTPATAGPYRAWADLRTTYGGFQEYAVTDIPAAAKPAAAAVDRTVKLEASIDGLTYALVLDTPTPVAGATVRARLRVADRAGRPFTKLEPVMGTFAHLVAFNENWKEVLHLHPGGKSALAATARGGPELSFRWYATEPGFYRVFAQIQIGGISKFVPFGVRVTPDTGR